MTCAQMGGMCEEKVSGNTAEEIIAAGMVHMEAAHPDMAEKVKAMAPDAPEMVAWHEKFMADFAATLEDATEEVSAEADLPMAA